MAERITADPSRREERLRRDIERLAGAIGERNVYRYPKLCEAAEFIEQAFRESGYESMRQEYKVRDRSFANIEAELKGQNLPEEILIIGAHYDSAHGSPGANDNGSGLAALLELARSSVSQRFSRTLRFVAFTNEERPFLRTPMMGSRVYARRCHRRKEKIVGMISLETIAYCSERRGTQWLSFLGALYPNRADFILFVANPASRKLLKYSTHSFRLSTDVPFETATLPSFAPGAKSSDHWSFWKEGYRALMLTDTAPLRYPHYHKHSDTPDSSVTTS